MTIQICTAHPGYPKVLDRLRELERSVAWLARRITMNANQLSAALSGKVYQSSRTGYRQRYCLNIQRQEAIASELGRSREELFGADGAQEAGA